jgi:uncharacterized protein YdaU (DUF1376 family)
MANSYPYFKWYAADAETDEFYVSLTFEEKGFYHHCLNRSWINWGLPPDPVELARSLGVTYKYLDKMWARIGLKFILTETVHPRYINKRQEQERESAIKKSQNNKRAGNANAFKSRPERVQNGPQRAYDSVSVSVSSKKLRKDGSPSFEDINAAWKWYQSEFPGDVNEFVELQLFLSIMETPEDLADLRKNLPLWKLTDKWVKRFYPSSENFLSKRMFKITPKLDAPSPGVGRPLNLYTPPKPEPYALEIEAREGKPLV